MLSTELLQTVPPQTILPAISEHVVSCAAWNYDMHAVAEMGHSSSSGELRIFIHCGKKDTSMQHGMPGGWRDKAIYVIAGPMAKPFQAAS